jgi:N12 class adenine-specific DNA methylase
MSSKPRRGYEVQGTFSRLPEFVERPLCVSCVLRPFTAAKPKAKELLAEYLLPPELQLAISLGKRVARYLSLVSSSEERALALAKRQHSELLNALQAFRAGMSHPPRGDKVLQAHAQQRKDIVALLSAFSADGALIPELREAPRYSPRYQGGTEDILAQALFLYQTERVVTLPALGSFRRSLGQEGSHDELQASLIAGRWCVDVSEWMPEREYLSGSLWPRYDRAKEYADQGDSVAAAQAAKLLEAISPVTISGIEPDPRLPWIPAQVVRSWLTEFTGTECPRLERRNHWLAPVARSIADNEGVPKPLSVGLGFLNHDNARFQIPDVSLEVDPDTGREESKSDAQARARLEYEDTALSSFRAFLRSNKPAAEQVAEVYNRTYRGYIEPTYTDFLLPARWGTRFSLRPHQQAGAARLLAHNGGLLAFDVGGGKTLTGIATIARLREEGRAQRPVVIVPNSILFQWLKQFQLALPDYRVLVIGAERYIAQNGVLASKTDTAQERAAKWRLFQAGGADVVLVSYSMFARVAVRAESRTQFVWNSSPMLKMFGVEMRDDLTEAQKPEGKEKKKPKKASKAQLEKLLGIKLQGMTAQEIEQAGEELATQNERAREAQLQRLRKLLSTLTSVSERERAILQDAIERWATGWEGEESDPGVFWEDLGIDCLMLDEAQNMKNLWPVPRRSGEEPPKYLGAIEKPSARALEFAIRAFLVRQKNGGSGVFLLSATPAKNSPIEYFSLLSLVDGDAWTRLGITDPDVFIDRYLKIEVRKVIDTDLKSKFREVVIGFMNLAELRDIVFRYAEFRTAEEVGLKLPKVEPQTIKVPMTASQAEQHAELLAEYRALIKERGTGAKNKALGILMRLALLSIHRELPFAPEVKQDEHRWTHANWRQVSSASSPKIEACASTVLGKRGCGHIVFCEPIAAHYWLREVLIAKGVPRERIAILNAEEAKTPLRRQAIAEAFNGTPQILDENGQLEQEAIPPAYDVVIANSVANEGIDLHIRTCYVHHLDLPWEPATLQQRNGRAVRQGNTQAVIGINYYVSQGSIDVVRLAIILGKLTWMKDILYTADRETNNPAAGSEMEGGDLVTFLYSPEQLSSLRVELARKKEAEDRRIARRRAWNIAKRLAEVNEGGRSRSPVEMGQAEHATRELLRQLDEIPTATWPWRQTLVPAMLDGFACAFLDLRYRAYGADDPPDAESAEEDLVVTAPLWERCVFSAPASDSQGADRLAVQFTVGQVTADAISIRRFGTVEWLRIVAGVLNSSTAAFYVSLHRALRQARPEQYDVGQWNRQQDNVLRTSELQQALERVPAKGVAALGARFAPDDWRQMLWDLWGAQVLERLDDGFVPIESGPLMLPATTLRRQGHNPLPWTERGFREFVERAKTETASGASYKWSELNDVSEGWFQRPFPKGVLGRKEDESVEVQLTTDQGATTVAAPWSQDGLAVTAALPINLPKGMKSAWLVTHMQSGLAVGKSLFHSVDSAKRFAEWLLTLGSWAGQEYLRIPIASRKAVFSVAAWIAKQPFVPSLEEVAAIAQGLG